MADFYSAVDMLAATTGAAGYFAFNADTGHGPFLRLVIAGCAISLCWLASVYFLFPTALVEGKRLLQKLIDRMRPTPVIADR